MLEKLLNYSYLSITQVFTRFWEFTHVFSRIWAFTQAEYEFLLPTIYSGFMNTKFEWVIGLRIFSLVNTHEISLIMNNPFSYKQNESTV